MPRPQADAGHRFGSSQPGHLHREENFVDDDSGITTIIVDNTTTGQADITVHNSVSGGVASVTASGSGITASPTTGAVVIANTGVTSNVAGTGISVSSATGAVTVGNTGVTSLACAGSTSCSASTGAITVTTSNVVSNGLTGATTFTAHGVVLGEGSTSLGLAPASTPGLALVTKGGSVDPIFDFPTGTVTAHGFVSTLSTAIPALPGAPVTIATVTVTTTVANERVQVLVTGAWNDGTLSGVNNNAATIVIDGSATAAGRAMASGAAGESIPFAVNWEQTITTAAAHTFEVTLNRSAIVATQGDADITVNAYAP